jgi:hypothetical protein
MAKTSTRIRKRALNTRTSGGVKRDDFHNMSYGSLARAGKDSARLQGTIVSGRTSV